MKSNLETIKKAMVDVFEHQDAVAFDKLKTEVKGFEKELREKLENVEMRTWHWDVLIKEILGE